MIPKPASFGNAFSLNNKYEFIYGETATIRALPKSGKNFASWSGGSVQNSNSEETTVFITGDISLTANFEANQYETVNSFYVIDRNNEVIPDDISRTDHWKQHRI